MSEKAWKAATDVAKSSHYAGFAVNEVVEDALEAYEQALDKELSPVIDPPIDPPSGDFKLFEILSYKNRGEVGEVGFHDLKIHYEGSMFDSKTDIGLPNRSNVQFLARSSPGIAVLDIERWADKHTWELTSEDVHKHLTVLNWYRDFMPATHKVGYYSIVPVRNYFGAVAGEGSAKFSQWQRWNDITKPIADAVDFLMPSIYTFDKFRNQTQWVKYAKAQIMEARRLAPDKPVYGVIWPHYHASGKEEIDGQFWRLQLDTMRTYADGLVIWDDFTKNKGVDFSTQRVWWGVTRDFVSDIS